MVLEEIPRAGIKVMRVDMKRIILVPKRKLIKHADGSDLRRARILLGL